LLNPVKNIWCNRLKKNSPDPVILAGMIVILFLAALIVKDLLTPPQVIGQGTVPVPQDAGHQQEFTPAGSQAILFPPSQPAKLDSISQQGYAPAPGTIRVSNGENDYNK